jgi:hypothetical protein
LDPPIWAECSSSIGKGDLICVGERPARFAAYFFAKIFSLFISAALTMIGYWLAFLEATHITYTKERFGH